MIKLTGFSIVFSRFAFNIIAQLSDCLFQFMYFRHFSPQSHVLSLSECLNGMPGILVVGIERREDENVKKRYIYHASRRFMQIEKLVMPPESKVLHYSFQEQTTEMNNELINIP